MRWIEVQRSGSLNGSVRISGSKNSSLALLSASCLCDEKIVLENIPNISDIDLVIQVEEQLGVKIDKIDNQIIINAANLSSSVIDNEKASAYRASYYFIGALLPKMKKVTLGYPGGDNLGKRPIDQHIKAFESMGARFKFFDSYYEVEAKKLTGTDIYFDVITSGATMNTMMAAVLAEGKTVLRNAARDPEVVDLAVFLNKMGAEIKGAGTDTIIIEGVKSLHSTCHSVIPDRLIAGSFLIAAGITGGTITVNDVIVEHLLPCIAKLEEAGINIDTVENSITASSDGKISGVNIKASMYPGFPTDLQQPITALLALADKNSTIIDSVYPERVKHCIELNKMGADIIINKEKFVIPGNKKLKGTWVHSSDVRAGICLILAGLNADGVTHITGIEHIERGYENIVEQFRSLGANIDICGHDTVSEQYTNTEVV